MQILASVRSHRWRIGATAATLVLLAGGLQSGAQPLPPFRLYVFDGGTLESDPARYRLTKLEVATTDLAVTAFLIVHPRGTLMWDTGAVADDTWTPTGAPVKRTILLNDYRVRPVAIERSLSSQLAAVGYKAADITYLSLSHYHWDHTANANAFAGATWLVRRVERDAMFPDPVPEVAQPSTFAALHNSRTVLLEREDHDVFGDGSVVLKATPGHTPGHQVLYVKLPKTGGVLLAGDLWHYPEERTLNRLPTADVDVDATRASRESIEAFVRQSTAQLWIQHDFTGMGHLKKAPQFYE